MAAVRDNPLHEVQDELKSVCLQSCNDYEPFENQVGVSTHRPPVLKCIMGVLLKLADEAVLPKRRLKIALAAVSKLNKCEFCVTHHAPRLVEQGFDAESTFESDCLGLNEKGRLVSDCATQVTNSANRVRTAMREQLGEYLKEAQTVELTLRIALRELLNQFNDSLGIGAEESAVVEMLVASGGAVAGAARSS